MGEKGSGDNDNAGDRPPSRHRFLVRVRYENPHGLESGNAAHATSSHPEFQQTLPHSPKETAHPRTMLSAIACRRSPASRRRWYPCFARMNSASPVFVCFVLRITGIGNSDAFAKLSESDLKLLRQFCRTFYIKAIVQIQRRFDFGDDVYSCLEVLTPRNVGARKPATLAQVFLRFPTFKTACDEFKAELEWRSSLCCP